MATDRKARRCGTEWTRWLGERKRERYIQRRKTGLYKEKMNNEMKVEGKCKES